MIDYEITIEKLGNIKRAEYKEGYYYIYVADYPSSFKNSEIKQDILNTVQLRKGTRSNSILFAIRILENMREVKLD